MGIWLKLPRAQVLASAIHRKVVFPEVAKLTLNMSRSNKVGFGGIRRFNRHLSPAIRYHNIELPIVLNYPRDRSAVQTSSIDIEFKDGSVTTLDAVNKDSVEIFNELITAAKGISSIPKRYPATTLELDPPTLLPNPKDA